VSEYFGKNGRKLCIMYYEQHEDCDDRVSTEVTSQSCHPSWLIMCAKFQDTQARPIVRKQKSLAVWHQSTLYSIGVHLSASECLGTMSVCQAKAPVPQGPVVSPLPVNELNVTICGTDRRLSASSSASSSPSGGDAHGEMGNPSAAEGGGGAGGGAAGRR